MSTRNERRSRAQWEAIIAEFRAGSESERIFCERRGLTLSTFRKQRYRFNARSRQVESAFVEVTPPGSTSEGVVLRYTRADGVCVHCPAGMSVTAIAELVEALRHGR